MRVAERADNEDLQSRIAILSLSAQSEAIFSVQVDVEQQNIWCDGAQECVELPAIRRPAAEFYVLRLRSEIAKPVMDERMIVKHANSNRTGPPLGRRNRERVIFRQAAPSPLRASRRFDQTPKRTGRRSPRRAIAFGGDRDVPYY